MRENDLLVLFGLFHLIVLFGLFDLLVKTKGFVNLGGGGKKTGTMLKTQSFVKSGGGKNTPPNENQTQFYIHLVVLIKTVLM